MTPTERENLRQALMRVPLDMLQRELERRHGASCEKLKPIADAFGISVKQLLSPSHSHRFTEARVAAAAKMHLQHGIPLKIIADKLFVKYDRVRHWLKYHYQFTEARPKYARIYKRLTTITDF